MSDLNRICISGNCTRDAELKSTMAGKPVLQLRIASNDRRPDSNGEWKDFPNYVDVVVFGARAESLSRFLSKGSRVIVDGRVRWSEWNGNDGHKHSKIEIIAEDVVLVSYQKDQQPSSASRSAEAPQGYHLGVFDDDIPF